MQSSPDSKSSGRAGGGQHYKYPRAPFRTDQQYCRRLYYPISSELSKMHKQQERRHPQGNSIVGHQRPTTPPQPPALIRRTSTFSHPTLTTVDELPPLSTSEARKHPKTDPHRAPSHTMSFSKEPPCYHQAPYTHCHQASYQPILTSPRSLEEGVLHGYPDRRYGTRRFALLLFMAILFIPFAYIVRSISGADTMNVLQISVVFVVEAARLYPWIGHSD